jgi:catechol 2,3-dioxygenase-like lactoylglutathione lyase family enzyme
MKRFHVHLAVPDLAASIRFYSGLFGMAPTVTHPDYAKWMLDDPHVNFAISARGGRPGLNHLGLQTDSSEELAAVRARFQAADAASTTAEPGAHCCYAVSDKHWVQDPQGIPWEAFHTLDSIPMFGASPAPAQASACCTDADAPPAQAGAGCGSEAPVAATPADPAAQRTSTCCAPRTIAIAAKSCC